MPFLEELYRDHESAENNPKLEEVIKLANKILEILFPDRCPKNFSSYESFEARFFELKSTLNIILHKIEYKLPASSKELAEAFFDKLPFILEMTREDAEAMTKNDPASTDYVEVVQTYPGFYAIAFHRMSHELWKLGIPYIPRVMSESAHRHTGIDINPGATIGKRFVMDHGTGIVIGETCEIGDDVKVYQNVTLGALSVSKNLASTKRHPTIGNNVIIYSGATILGGKTYIGEGTLIGGNVWLTHSVPAKSKVFNTSTVDIKS